jgi:hypothetical protein
MADENQDQKPNADAALLSAFQQFLQGQRTEAKAPEPPPKPTVTLPADAPAEVYSYLRSLEEQLGKRVSADREAEDTRARTELQKRVERLGKERGEDSGKFMDVLGQFEQFYTGKLKERDQRVSSIESKFHDTLRLVEVGGATAGVQWVSAAAEKQGKALLNALLEIVTGQDGTPIIRGKAKGQAVTDVVKEALATEEFAHLLDAKWRGKGGLGGGNTPSPTGTPGAAEAPNNLDEAVIQRWKAKNPAGTRTVGLGGVREAK